MADFVEKSDGYLFLRKYERVDFYVLPDDGLEIRYVLPGRDNELKLTLEGVAGTHDGQK